jgi:hypothetical protein
MENRLFFPPYEHFFKCHSERSVESPEEINYFLKINLCWKSLHIAGTHSILQGVKHILLS